MNVITITPSGQIISSTILSDGINVSISGSSGSNNTVSFISDDNNVTIFSTDTQSNSVFLSSSYSENLISVTSTDFTTPSILTINEGQQGPPGANGADGQDGIVSVQNYGLHRIVTSLSDETAVYAHSNLLFDGIWLTLNGTGVSLSGHIHSEYNDISNALSNIPLLSNKCYTSYIIIQDSFTNIKKIHISDLMSAVKEIDGGGVINSVC